MSIHYYEDGLLIFDNHGQIDYCGEFIDDLFCQEINLNHTGSLIIPGLVDIHTHLPQFQARGNYSGELLDWLEKVIMPLESKFSDLRYAEKVTNDFFTKLISTGTTTVSLYSSHIPEATELAFTNANRCGIRAFIGNTLMDVESQPSELNTLEIIYQSQKLIKKFHHSNSLVQYILTPRYAGSCSMGLMKKCAEMALEHNLSIQTHIAENQAEVGFIKALFPKYDDYLSVYEAAGILNSKTILAHCIYLNNHELDLLLEKNASIAHCPASNRFLKSGIMPLQKYIELGCRIGLGTDIAGGYNISVLDEAREAIESSKYYSLFIDSNSEPISSSEAFYLATLGGADCLGIKSKTGSLDQGKDADFVIIDLFNYQADKSADGVLNNLFYATDNRRIMETWVKGNKIWGINSH
jgi:guanine deaminase